MNSSTLRDELILSGIGDLVEQHIGKTCHNAYKKALKEGELDFGLKDSENLPLRKLKRASKDKGLFVQGEHNIASGKPDGRFV